MNGISRRQKPSGPSAANMNGRRRPIGVWKVSLHGPITGDNVSANTPSAPSTSPINVPDSVNRCRSGGRYAAVVVIENASPKAPAPRIQKTLRLTAPDCRAASAVTCVTASDLGDYAVGGEPAADHQNDHLLCTRDRLVPVLELAEHPAGEDLLDCPVEDVAGHARIEVRTEFTIRLTAGDDPLEPGDALLQVRAACHLAHEHADEVRVAAPRAQQELGDSGETVSCALVGLLDRAHCVEDVAPRLAEDRLEQLFLRTEVVVEQAVRETRFLGDVTDPAGVVALARKHAHGSVENEPTLVLLAC